MAWASSLAVAMTVLAIENAIAQSPRLALLLQDSKQLDTEGLELPALEMRLQLVGCLCGFDPCQRLQRPCIDQQTYVQAKTLSRCLPRFLQAAQ